MPATLAHLKGFGQPLEGISEVEVGALQRPLGEPINENLRRGGMHLHVEESVGEAPIFDLSPLGVLTGEDALEEGAEKLPELARQVLNS